MLRAARVAEAAGRASGTRASGAGGACSASAAACETRSGVRPRAGAGTRRWVSGEAARGGESASDASRAVAVDLAAAAKDVAFFFENLVVDLSGARLSYRNMRVREGVVTLDLDLEVVGFPPPSSLGMI